MTSSRVLFSAWLATAGFAAAALTDNFETGTYPNTGTGWSAGWAESTSTNNVDGSVINTNPINGGGNYLSVTNTVNSTNLGINRNIGSMVNSIYTLSFDWRLDSPLTTFTTFNDRIHFGSNNDASFGTTNTWGWIIGVSAADNGTTNTVFDGNWYFYNNQSTSANGNFDSADMVNTNVALVSGVTYSFTVTVNSTAQTYSASMVGSNGTSFSASNLNFRNQASAGTNQTNLVFGGAVSASSVVGTPTESLTWSLDNVNVVPEPSSLILAGLSGLLCFKRRRITG